MERLNLNVPDETRRKLKRLAARADLREAELARELLVRAVDDEEKREIRERFRSSMNPELRKRLLEINRAMEGLRGGAR
jgi:ssRNA-specific RNase YbeY (16S rRNA maturation enzyme)